MRKHDSIPKGLIGQNDNWHCESNESTETYHFRQPS